MTNREITFNKAVKNLKGFMPQIRHAFNEAVIHCEQLANEYQNKKKIALSLEDLEAVNDDIRANITKAKAEFWGVLWGLKWAIERIEHELDPVTGSWAIIKDLFHGAIDTAEIIGEMIMMDLIPAVSNEDNEELKNIALKLRRILADIEAFIDENTNQKGE